MADFYDVSLLPHPSEFQLKEAFVGKTLHEVPMPAAVVDRAIVRRNCDRMLEACKEVQLDFRPHVETHKTTEVTRMQVGDATSNVRIVISTLAEAEHLLDYLLDSVHKGKPVNVLYGIPLPPSQVPRLARLAKVLGPGSISVLIDDPAQLSAASVYKGLAGFPLQLFIKIDTGYHRAGVPPKTAAFRRLIQIIIELEQNEFGILTGFYCHAGHSYGSDSSVSARKLLTEEIEGLRAAAADADLLRPSDVSRSKYILSVGATPTATSIKDLMGDTQEPAAGRLRHVIQSVNEDHILELHAGVYPFLDMQQLATGASSTNVPCTGEQRFLTQLDDVALSILVEVVSVYGNRSQPEALIAAGTLALGREPCKSYEGWGIVSHWGMKSTDSAGECGWKVGRISQEHSILTRHYDSKENGYHMLRTGQRLRIWPNHACVASASFSWYLVIDSRLPGSRQDEIVDVWVRCRGW